MTSEVQVIYRPCCFGPVRSHHINVVMNDRAFHSEKVFLKKGRGCLISLKDLLSKELKNLPLHPTLKSSTPPKGTDLGSKLLKYRSLEDVSDSHSSNHSSAQISRCHFS